MAYRPEHLQRDHHCRARDICYGILRSRARCTSVPDPCLLGSCARCKLLTILIGRAGDLSVHECTRWILTQAWLRASDAEHIETRARACQGSFLESAQMSSQGVFFDCETHARVWGTPCCLLCQPGLVFMDSFAKDCRRMDSSKLSCVCVVETQL